MAKAGSRSVQFLIRVYQKTLSPDHGPLRVFFRYGVCRYEPTCSTYMHEAIGVHGLSKGIIMGVWRIMRCNPWSEGGPDPVPKLGKKAE